MNYSNRNEMNEREKEKRSLIQCVVVWMDWKYVRNEIVQ